MTSKQPADLNEWKEHDDDDDDDDEGTYFTYNDEEFMDHLMM